jgi:hypothetical protein
MEKKKLIGSLVFLLIVFTLTVPLLPSAVVKASAAPVEIRDWYDLHAVRNNLGGSYVLMNDLDATTAGYSELASEVANEGKGWEPIGIYQPDGLFESFTGIFDGQGHEIRDFFINRPDDYGVGLFGAVTAGEEGEGGVIKNIGVVNASVIGNMGVGGLIGLSAGIVSNSYSSANTSGDSPVGGLVGVNAGTITNSHCTGLVTASGRVGGLVGLNSGSVNSSYSSGSVSAVYDMVGGLVGYNLGAVSSSYSNATVNGERGIGGLIGANDGGRVNNSYSTGKVTGDRNVGGLVGHNWNWDATVGSCYASSSVTGNDSVGGLVGYNDLYASVYISYATGSVAGNSSVGGLVGYNRGTVTDSYAVGSVAGNSSTGGLVGLNDDVVLNCFWDKNTSGMKTSAGGTAKTTTQMMAIATFTDTRTEGLNNPWDITSVASGETNDAYAWNIVDGESYPFLSGKQWDQFTTYNLNISLTLGGQVVTPVPGAHTFLAGAVVDLVAKPDKGYRFDNWTGDVATIADATAPRTTIAMTGNYSITANFEQAPPRPNWLLIGSIIGAVVVVRLLVLFVSRRRKVR